MGEIWVVLRVRCIVGMWQEEIYKYRKGEALFRVTVSVSCGEIDRRLGELCGSVRDAVGVGWAGRGLANTVSITTSSIYNIYVTLITQLRPQRVRNA